MMECLSWELGKECSILIMPETNLKCYRIPTSLQRRSTNHRVVRCDRQPMSSHREGVRGLLNVGAPKIARRTIANVLKMVSYAIPDVMEK